MDYVDGYVNVVGMVKLREDGVLNWLRWTSCFFAGMGRIGVINIRSQFMKTGSSTVTTHVSGSPGAHLHHGQPGSQDNNSSWFPGDLLFLPGAWSRKVSISCPGSWLNITAKQSSWFPSAKFFVITMLNPALTGYFSGRRVFLSSHVIHWQGVKPPGMNKTCRILPLIQRVHLKPWRGIQHYTFLPRTASWRQSSS